MTDRSALRTSSTLLITGSLGHVLVTMLHTGGPANDHEEVFGDYAASTTWVPVHLAQFVTMALLVAGMVVLCRALTPPEAAESSTASLLPRLGALAAGVALALYGVLQAVDGVALKHAVDAWAAAPQTDRAARFASAETVRWLEWGTRGYHCLALGAAMLLVGAAVARTSDLPRGLGLLVAASAVPYLVQAWVLGNDGFTEPDTLAILAGEVLLVTWSAWLAVASRTRVTEAALAAE